GGPEQGVPSDRGGAKLEEDDALAPLDEELHAEREAELVGERRLLEDDHRLGVAARAAQDRPVGRDAVAKRDRAVEAARRAGEQAFGASNRALERSRLRQRERKRPEAGLVVEENDRAHISQSADGGG